jgi:hypothetical protein
MCVLLVGFNVVGIVEHSRGAEYFKINVKPSQNARVRLAELIKDTQLWLSE